MQRRGAHTGLTILRRKDGTDLTMNFRASQTRVGGMELYVGVCWPGGGLAGSAELHTGA